MRKRYVDILWALEALGGKATTRQVAHLIDLTVSGTSQSLKRVLQPKGYIKLLGQVKGGDTAWQLLAKGTRELEKHTYPKTTS